MLANNGRSHMGKRGCRHLGATPIYMHYFDAVVTTDEGVQVGRAESAENAAVGAGACRCRRHGRAGETRGAAGILTRARRREGGASVRGHRRGVAPGNLATVAAANPDCHRQPSHGLSLDRIGMLQLLWTVLLLVGAASRISPLARPALKAHIV